MAGPRGKRSYCICGFRTKTPQGLGLHFKYRRDHPDEKDHAPLPEGQPAPARPIVSAAPKAESQQVIRDGLFPITIRVPVAWRVIYDAYRTGGYDGSFEEWVIDSLYAYYVVEHGHRVAVMKGGRA